MLKPKLLDQVRDAIMGKARRMMTEEAYVYWIKQCILFMLVQACSLNQTFCTVLYVLNVHQSQTYQTFRFNRGRLNQQTSYRLRTLRIFQSVIQPASPIRGISASQQMPRCGSSWRRRAVQGGHSPG